LFDPVSQQFDWPVNWAFRLSYGFNRSTPTPLSEPELASIDAVMYSHIHYDHFNKSDIEQIGNQPKYLTPLGIAKHFPNNGYDITEMAWYANQRLGDLTIHFVPAHHFSSRILVPYLYQDRDKALWGGWYRYVHTSPEDSLNAAAKLNCKVMIPWGLWQCQLENGRPHLSFCTISFIEYA
jgi:N-acyl-phosphatidylethanolamine-hydrolysing phospholipase D